MGLPRILWDNEVIDGTITADNEDTGFPDNNLATWLDWERWRAGTLTPANSFEIEVDFGSASPASITAFALAGHNFNTVGARYKLEGSNDADASAPTWTSIVAYTTPGDDFVKVHFFNSVTYATYRLTIDNNGGANFIPQLGILFLGDYLEFEHVPVAAGFDPDRQEDFGERQRSETGYELGYALDHTMRNLSVTFDHLDPAWVESDWLPFWSEHRNEPFFWAWDSAETDQAYLVHFTTKTMNAPYRNPLYRQVTLEMMGRLEE
jgi:hypothetical protein